MSKDATSFLMGGGLKGARFIKGQPVRGLITEEPEVRQQTDYNTKEPKFFKSGEPMMQLVVTVKTDQRDPDTANDDGTRGFYIKNQLTKVVRDAVRAAGGPGLEVGGELTLTWVGGGPRYEGDTSWQKDSPKIFTASYVKPTPAATNFLNGGPAAPQYAPGFAPQPPFTQPAPAAPAWHGDPATNPAQTWGQPVQAAPAPVAQPTADIPAPPGVDAGAWAQLPPEQKQHYLAVMPR